METKGMRCYVSGRVQGVWFRASTQTMAKELGLTGWALNLADGRVEVCAFGETHQLATLRDWLAQGPPLANVTEVTYEEIPWHPMSDFSVR